MNIILILADDLGWSDIGYHKSNIFTPTLDTLAQTGLRLNKSYSFSICTPSRAGLLSGKYPFKYGLQGVLYPWDTGGLDENYLLSNFLKDNGYDCYMIGKWHLGNQKEYQPLNKGFDYHFGMYNGCLGYWDHKYYNVHDLHENGNPSYECGHTTDLFTNKATSLIQKQNKDKPFFMYLCYNAPHVPLQPAMCEDWYGRFIKDPQRTKYAALVTHMDFSIGRIIATLTEKNILDDTLIWFMSDNGGWIGQGGNNNPLKGGKCGCYEGGVKNISFINYKPLNKTIFNKRCHIIDIFPTLAYLINKPMPIEVDGKNIFTADDRYFILFILKDKNQEVYQGAVIYKNWKYIKLNQEELYDIENDPNETTNIIGTHQNIAKELFNILHENKDKCIPDIPKWYGKDGPPPDYKFPQYWGQSTTISHLIASPPVPPPSNYEELILLPAIRESSKGF